MIIYEDIFTEDIFTDNETFSDAYPTKLIDDLYYEAEGRLISIHNSIDDALIGGNASAEADGDGGADDAKEKEGPKSAAFLASLQDERSTAKTLVTQVTQPPPPLELDPRKEPVPLSHKEAQAWFYQDPQGEIQGPFLSTEMTEWFRAGYFNMTLMVKRGCDSNMLPLGELIKRWDRVPFLPGPLLPPVLMPGTGVRQTSFSAIDLVSVFKLMKYDLDKKAYQKHIQAYGKKILAKWQETERTEEEISAYKKKLATKVKDILAHFGDYDIYIHESYDDTNDDPMPAVPCEIESNEVPSPPTESSATTESTTESSDSTASIIPHEPSISPKPTMVPAHADTAPIASTLSPEDEQALFNLFMDDSVPGDALFRVPSNFEEILDESLDRLSSQTENIIILDDADVDNNTGSGPTMSAIDSPDARPKEIRSEEDLVITGTKPGTTVYGYRPGQSLPQKKIPELKISSKVFAKKSNDIWYRGVIIEITNEHKEPRHREFRIRFDGNGQKSVGSKHLAPIPSNPAELEFIVGSRVIALYEEEQSTPQVQRSWFAGIIAEPPCSRNKNRYLVFFDDGYAQYTDPKKVLNVYYQSPHVWEDIHEDSRSFMKSYLQQYPERPMVRLQTRDVVKTEWRGKWWSARVQEVDGSLVKMYFEADDRIEWIYRGSTRLEPLYKELANTRRLATTTNTSGNAPLRRHNLGARNTNKPFVEYTRDFNDVQATQPLTLDSSQQGTLGRAATSNTSIDQRQVGASSASSLSSSESTFKKKANVAKKSTGGSASAKAPAADRYLGNHMTNLQQDKLQNDVFPRNLPDITPQPVQPQQFQQQQGQQQLQQQTGNQDWVRKKYNLHKCSLRCLGEATDDPQSHKGCNPLLIPIYCGWERQVSKPSLTNVRKHVNYRAPCARRLRTLDEIQSFLILTDSQLTIDLFCFDPNVHTQYEFIPAKTFCDIKDISYGNEAVPVSCVNGLDRLYPDYVEYSTKRHPGDDVKLNLNSAFMVCCDCEDMCLDSTKCACRKLTIEASAALNKDAHPMDNAGYKSRRLGENLTTAVYECNANCHCDRRCTNRVAQQGLAIRLQVFKTGQDGFVNLFAATNYAKFITVYHAFQ